MTELPPRIEQLAKAGMDNQWNARGTLTIAMREVIAPLAEAAKDAANTILSAEGCDMEYTLACDLNALLERLNAALARLERTT